MAKDQAIQKDETTKYKIGDPEKMLETHNEMIKTLKAKSIESGIDLSDILEKLSQEKRADKIYCLVAEAISRL